MPWCWINRSTTPKTCCHAARAFPDQTGSEIAPGHATATPARTRCRLARGPVGMLFRGEGLSARSVSRALARWRVSWDTRGRTITPGQYCHAVAPAFRYSDPGGSNASAAPVQFGPCRGPTIASGRFALPVFSHRASGWWYPFRDPAHAGTGSKAQLLKFD